MDAESKADDHFAAMGFVMNADYNRYGKLATGTAGE